jgi:hypothetical protein
MVLSARVCGVCNDATSSRAFATTRSIACEAGKRPITTGRNAVVVRAVDGDRREPTLSVNAPSVVRKLPPCDDVEAMADRMARTAFPPGLGSFTDGPGVAEETGSAQAVPLPTNRPAPTPNATANPLTRPTNAEALIAPS